MEKYAGLALAGALALGVTYEANEQTSSTAIGAPVAETRTAVEKCTASDEEELECVKKELDALSYCSVSENQRLKQIELILSKAEQRFLEGHPQHSATLPPINWINCDIIDLKKRIRALLALMHEETHRNAPKQ